MSVCLFPGSDLLNVTLSAVALLMMYHSITASLYCEVFSYQLFACRCMMDLVFFLCK
jgi:hypothetical protein